jgi:signal transduction histidine kinase
MARPPKGSIPLPGLRWRGLNLQFFALIFLPLTGILFFITFGSLNLHQDAMRTLVGERDERAARTAASAMNEQLNHRAAAVRGLGLRAADQVDPGSILPTSDFLGPDFDYGLAFFTYEGELLTHTGDEVLWVNLPPEFNALLDETHTWAGEQTVFSPVLPHPNLDDNLVFVAFIATDKSPLAVGAFSPTTLARRTLAGAFSPGEESSVFLITPDHQIIYQIGGFSPSEDPEQHPGIEEALRGESGTTYIPVDGNEHVIAFSPVILTGWALVIEEPWDSVANPLLNTTQLAPLVLVPVLLLALVALWFGARQIIQPLQALETRASDLAWGNYKTIDEPVGGIEEINRLQQTLIHLAEKVQRAQAGLHDYIGAITTGQEDERRRLARELHDDTIQALIALNQRVQLTKLKLAEDPDVSSALEEIQTLTEQTIQDLRRVVRALRPLYLDDLGLVAALRMLVQETSVSCGIPIEFINTGIEKRLPPENELAFYRMAQEGLSNIFRHAQASKATLVIAYTPVEIQLTIEDDGCGFAVPESPAEFAPNGNFGLLGIHERTELIGARFGIQSILEEGTILKVVLPIKNEML